MLSRRLIEYGYSGALNEQIGIRHFDQLLGKAQRFIFSPTASQAIEDVARDEISLERARPQIFSPYELAWFEARGDKGVYGWLWCSDNHSYQNGQVIVVLWPPADDKPKIFPCLLNITLMDRPPLIVNPKYHHVIGQELPSGSTYFPRRYGQRMLAAFALIASKGITATVPADLTKLNKARQKRGKWPLLGYSEIRLVLDAERVVHASRAIGTGHMPLHHVRAHLRLLRTGKVVIVRAHVRGNPEYGTKLQHYSVETTADQERQADVT